MRNSLFVFFYLLMGSLLWGQSGEDGYFEGTLEYKVQLKGPLAEQLMLNEPNNELQMHLKDGSYIINLKGGRYPKTFLYSGHEDKEYSMDVKEKVAYKYSAHYDLNKENKKVPIAQYTGKTAEVEGVICEVYQMQEDDAQFTFFVSDQYRVNIGLYEGKKQAKTFFLVKGLDGRIPLKILKKTPEISVMTLLVNTFPREFDDEQFRLPADFQVRNRDYRP